MDEQRVKYWMAKYERSRTPTSRRSILKLAREYMGEAKRKGVHFRVTQDKGTGLYYVSVKGEEGEVSTVFERLPNTLHALLLMGEVVRARYFSYLDVVRRKEAKLRFKATKV